MGYAAMAFIVLIPAFSYYTVSHGLPKRILLIAIPGYATLAYGCYKEFNRLKSK